jgi:uncharacterized protein (TIGR03067 family)
VTVHGRANPASIVHAGCGFLGASFSSGRFTMRQLIGAVVFLALAVPIARADEKDAKKLEGTYEVVALLVDGAPSEKKNDVKSITIKAGEIILEGKSDENAKFTVDPAKKPAHIDITPKGKEKNVLGIYETKDTDKGMELNIAFSKDGAERPKDFKGEGKNEVVIKLFRKK